MTLGVRARGLKEGLRGWGGANKSGVRFLGGNENVREVSGTRVVLCGG